MWGKVTGSKMFEEVFEDIFELFWTVLQQTARYVVWASSLAGFDPRENSPHAGC